MKSRVELSNFSAIATALCMLLFIGMIVGYYFIAPLASAICSVIIIPTLAVSLWYAPLSIEATDKEIYINRSISLSKRIPYSEIESVKLCPPTMGAIRICGSGGFLGYWGWFREKDLGKYFAYYGKSSDCFLVTLKSGKKYMLGCKDPKSMVSEIESHL